MAEGDDQDRSQEATPKRKDDARKKGDIPRSRDMNTMLMLLVAATFMLMMGDQLIEDMMNVMRHYFMLAKDINISEKSLPAMFLEASYHMCLALLPFILVMVLTAIVAPLIVSGWNFSGQALKFKFERMDPIAGFKRLFGMKGMVELFKASAKFIVIGTVALLFLWSQMEEVLSVNGNGDINTSLKLAAELIAWSFLIVSAATILLAGFDVPYQLYEYRKKLKMSFQQVKQERKDLDGNPELKGKIRQQQLDMSRRRMMEEVPYADVIVTNPTHYSVALKYDQEDMGAPRVVAKGADVIALRIRQVGQQNNITILETPPLARALYYSTSIGEEIPAGLYQAVAQIMAYVFQLKENAGAANAQPLPEDLPIPEEFRR